MESCDDRMVEILAGPNLRKYLHFKGIITIRKEEVIICEIALSHVSELCRMSRGLCIVWFPNCIFQNKSYIIQKPPDYS